MASYHSPMFSMSKPCTFPFLIKADELQWDLASHPHEHVHAAFN